MTAAAIVGTLAILVAFVLGALFGLELGKHLPGGRGGSLRSS